MNKYMILFFFLFIFGCLVITTPPTPKTFTLKLTKDNPCYDKGPCMCMVCENKTEASWWAWWINVKASSLFQGTCSFIQCDWEKMIQEGSGMQKIEDLLDEKKIEKTNRYLKFFMIGQGPSFAAFDEANAYCNNFLEFAVKWLIGDENTPPPVPVGGRAACYLDVNVIPVYVYYTGGKNIDANRMGEIAKALDETVQVRRWWFDKKAKIGPVIIFPEIGFKPEHASDVAAQINQIKNNCEKCLVGLAPDASNEEEAIKAITNVLAQGVGDKIDLFGQMVIANALPDCNYKKIVQTKINFSKYLLSRYNKPSIWLYYGVAEGTNELSGEETCEWTPELIADAYDYLFMRIPDMVSAGIVGVAGFQWRDREFALAPDEKKWGFVDEGLAQKHPIFNSWFNLCRKYTDISRFSRVPLLFSYHGANGSRCSALTVVNMYDSLFCEPGERKYDMSEMTPDTSESRFRCDSCFNELFGELPEELLGGVGVPSSVPEGPGGDICSGYSYEIAESSELCDFDPLVIRAIGWQESSFDEYAVSCVKETSTCTGDCFLKYDDVFGYLPTINPCGEGEKPCACGLLQCIDPPSLTYDPFKAPDNIDCGVGKICEYWEGMKSALKGRYSKLASTSGSEREKYNQNNWMALFLALIEYNAGADGVKKAYESWEKQSECPNPMDVGSYCAWEIETTQDDFYREYEEYTDPENCILSAPYDFGVEEDEVIDCKLVCCGEIPESEWGALGMSLYVRNTCCSLKACYESTQKCETGNCGDENCCGKPGSEFATYACSCEDAVREGGKLGYPCEVLAKYQAILKNCPNSCEGGPGPSPKPPGCPYGGGTGGCVIQSPTGGVGVCTSKFCEEREYYYPGGYYHGGIDIAESGEVPIYAAHTGIVRTAGYSTTAGYWVVIDGDDGCRTQYMHLRENLQVRTGDYVGAGRLIGYMGNTGRSRGQHLHFEVWLNTEDKMSRVDPNNWLGLTCPDKDEQG